MTRSDRSYCVLTEGQNDAIGQNRLTRFETQRGDLMPQVSGSGAPAVKLITSQLNDIRRKVGRVGNDRRCKRGRRKRWFGQRRFNQD